MKGMYQDADCFAFLDEMRDKGEMSTIMALVALIEEFPGLRPDEERASTAPVDWQPFSGHFLQRLRPAFLNSTGLM